MSKFTFYLSGWAGLALILLFTINAAFSGTRLGLCWMMLEERYEEFRKEIRDPYPSIGEKAVGRLVKRYLDLSTQPNEPEKLLTSNIHLLSPQKWSQFVYLNRENLFPRGQP